MIDCSSTYSSLHTYWLVKPHDGGLLFLPIQESSAFSVFNTLQCNRFRELFYKDPAIVHHFSALLTIVTQLPRINLFPTPFWASTWRSKGKVLLELSKWRLQIEWPDRAPRCCYAPLQIPATSLNASLL